MLGKLSNQRTLEMTSISEWNTLSKHTAVQASRYRRYFLKVLKSKTQDGRLTGVANWWWWRHDNTVGCMYATLVWTTINLFSTVYPPNRLSLFLSHSHLLPLLIESWHYTAPHDVGKWKWRGKEVGRRGSTVSDLFPVSTLHSVLQLSPPFSLF